MYMLSFYVPESHVDIVKDAIFAAGAGKIGDYSHCSWQILGEGQFLPLPGSKPFLGQQNQVEKVAEYKVETICDTSCISTVIAELKRAHPYEVPAYQVSILVDF